MKPDLRNNFARSAPFRYSYYTNRILKDSRTLTRLPQLRHVLLFPLQVADLAGAAGLRPARDALV